MRSRNFAAVGSGVVPGALLALLASACGEPAVDLQISFESPWTAALATQGCVSSFDNLLRAELRVGGHLNQDCPLSFDEQRVVSGSCAEITVGIIRPVALVWLQDFPAWVTDPPDQLAPVAYFLSYVDLQKTSLTGGQTTVTVSFVDDGEKGDYYTEQAVVESINTQLDSTASEIEKARAWLKAEGRKKANRSDPSLDEDDDACRNLTEACNGTLYDPEHNYLDDPFTYTCDD